MSNSYASRLALCASALTLLQDTNALYRSKAPTDPAYLFDIYNGAQPDPNISSSSVAAANQVVWTIKTQSFYDEDKGTYFMDFINEVKMPILSTDIITFHVEYSSSDNTDDLDLKRDGFDCVLSKDSASDYWVTEDPIDYHVRTTDDAAAVEDFNNSAPLDGKNYFVSTQDKDRDSHLCTSSVATSVYQCESIKCIVRRDFLTYDADDMPIEPTDASATTLTFANGYSYIRLNQVGKTDPHWLQTLPVATPPTL